MTSIRNPFTLVTGRGSRKGELGLPVTTDAAPQPPLAHDDPRLQAFLRVTFDVLYDWNIQTGAIYFSAQIDEILGLAPNGLPRSIGGWLARIHPDDRGTASDALWESVSSASAYTSEYRLRHEDGSWVTVTDQGVVLNDDEGRPASMIGAMRDVTVERRALGAVREANELRSALFCVPSPAIQVDAKGNYLAANARATAFFEKTLDGLLEGSVGDDFPPEVLVAVTGEADRDREATELEVDCSVGGRVKTLILNVIPCSTGEGRGSFLLGTDITERKAMQNELGRSERALRRQATIIGERNVALRVLLEQREQDRVELEERIVRNVELLIQPTLDRLSHSLSHRPERMDVDALRANLREIVGPFGERLSSAKNTLQPLTRREVEVADLVRLGRTTDEIAEILHVSRSVVSFHRANLRRKMGLPKRGPRLSTHLADLGRTQTGG